MEWFRIFKYELGYGILNDIWFLICYMVFLLKASVDEVNEFNSLRRQTSSHNALASMYSRMMHRNADNYMRQMREQEQREYEQSDEYIYGLYPEMVKKEINEENERWSDLTDAEKEERRTYKDYIEKKLTRWNFFSQQEITTIKLDMGILLTMYDKINGLYTAKFVAPCFNDNTTQYIRCKHLYEIQAHITEPLVYIRNCMKAYNREAEKHRQKEIKLEEHYRKYGDLIKETEQWQNRHEIISGMNEQPLAKASESRSTRRSNNSQMNDRVDHVRQALGQAPAIDRNLFDGDIF